MIDLPQNRGTKTTSVRPVLIGREPVFLKFYQKEWKEALFYSVIS